MFKEFIFRCQKIFFNIIKPNLKVFIDERKGFTVKKRFFIFFWKPFILENSHETIEEAEQWAKASFIKNKKKIRL